MKELTPYTVTCRNGITVQVGDVMKNDPYSRRITSMRDDYLGAMSNQRTMKKKWFDDFCAERFIVTAVGHNGYCPTIQYRKVNSQITGECMAGELDFANEQQ
jgi:hypothetical protein